MTEEKRNRLIAALTVNVILFAVILLAVCIYQLVTIVNLNNIKKDVQTQINVYETATEKNEKTLEYYQSREGLLDKAYEYGFVFGK
ncbi:MAG: hypothetical protein K2L12_05610 [Clostridia bacterium]|nr:hypothetical protein [Clostridia bacterium]